MKKIISVMLLMIVITFTLSNVVLADEITNAMATVGNASNSAFFNNLGSKLYGIILIVGSAVALGMLAIMAVKFMTSEAEEKAQVKKNLIGYTIGLLILLCVISILGIFQNIANSINGAAGTIVIPGTSGSNANSGQSTNNGSQSSNNSSSNSSGSNNSGTSSSGKVTASEWQDYQNAQADWYLKHGTWATTEQLGPKYEDIYNRKNFYGIEGEDSSSSSSTGNSDSSQSSDESYEGKWEFNAEINENGGLDISYTKDDTVHVSEADRKRVNDKIEQWKKENPGKAVSHKNVLGPELYEVWRNMNIEDMQTQNTNNSGSSSSSGSNSSSTQSSNSSSSSSNVSSSSVSQADRKKLTDALKQWAKENPGKNCNIAKDLGPEYYEIYRAMRIEDAKNKQK